MAITPTESGLTDDQYAALQTQQDKYTHQILVERQNLVFESFSSGGGSAGWQTDAIILDGYIFRSVGTAIIRTLIADGTYTDVSPSSPSGLTPGSTYALVASSGTLYVFAATATGVQLITTANYGSSWSSWAVIVASSDQTIYSGNVARDGTASASSSYSSSTATYPASNAFDYTLATAWYTPISTTTGTLQYDLGSGVTKVATRYKVTANGTYAPKTWTFQGSNNGSSWTTLDTQTGITGWGSPETRVYSFSNSTAYRYYRLNITANVSATQLSVTELSIHETITDESIILVAAVSSTRMHFVYCDGVTKTYNLRVVEYISSSWTPTSSSILLTDRPYNLGVASLGIYDILLLETNVAGRAVDTLDGTALTTVRKKAGGLITFHYNSSAITWSTHYGVDVIDELSAVDFMRYSHIKSINDTLHVTAWIGSGTEAHPITGFYDYTSTDGIHWSTRSRLYFGAAQSTYGAILLQLDEYAYAVEYGQIWRSLSTQFTGYTAVSLQEDISVYISDWNFNQGDLAQLTLILDNADGYFDDHAFISKTNKLLFTLKFGGFVDGETLLYQLGLFEMDSFSVGETIPEHMIQISARDYMGRMVEKVQASEFRSYDSYLIGVDDYYAKNNQNYGGLSHLYTVFGQIDADVGAVRLATPGESVGFSTFAEDIWNGEVSCSITVSTGSQIGLVFRGKNATQFWSFVYDFATDKVILKSVNGSGVSLYTSGTLSWAATIPTVYHFLRVRFLYGEVRCYISTDAITWTLKTTLTMDVSNKQAPDSPYYSDPLTYFDPCERGSVGIYGLIGISSYATVTNFRLNDFSLPLTVEDAFKAYASFARIHDHEFETLLKPGDDAWVSGTSVTVDTGLATGYYGEDVYDGALYG